MADYQRPNSKTLQSLRDIANQLRIDTINATEACSSGHPTSCASAAEIVSVLFFHTMRYDLKFPKDPRSDRFVLSKGHAAPILYAAWAEAGLFDVNALLGLRTLDSDLEGHPTPISTIELQDIHIIKLAARPLSKVGKIVVWGFELGPWAMRLFFVTI